MSPIQKVTLAIEFIEANLTHRLDLDMISKEIHYSKYHLHRVFSQTVGLTIHDYIKRRQLTEAAKLLVFSERPIIDIALLAGYRSQQAFTSIFSDMYKIPPSQYRENEKFYPLQLKFKFEGSYDMLNQNKEVPWNITFAGDNASLGIILKTRKAAEDFCHALSGKCSVSLITPETITFQKGVTVTSIQMSKGLEFDEVVIPGADSRTYSTEYDRSLLYIACTRAMHKLTLLYTGKRSKLIEET